MNITSFEDYTPPFPTGSSDIAARDYNPVAEIMAGFEFERVHKAMMALDWKWYFSDYDEHVPTLNEIKDDCYKRLCFAIDTGRVWDSGGFSIEIDEIGVLYLAFTVEAMESHRFSSSDEYFTEAKPCTPTP